VAEKRLQWWLMPNFMSSTIKAYGSGVANGAKSELSAFRQFLNRGNMVDVAIGLVMASAFTAVVTSVVTDIITPFIALASPQSSFANKFAVIKCPPGANCRDLATVEEATKLGAITVNYGKFLESIISFFFIGLVVYFLAKAYNAAFRPHKPVKSCPYCCKDIPTAAVKCAFCASPLN
jgi:large conductance mechanosensitive channel